MHDSIFTKIIKGDIPSHKIYEDDKTLAFMDIHPVNEGHVLVIPKTQVEFVWELPGEDYSALMTTVQKVMRRQKEVLGCPYVSMRTIGVDVPHAHVHLIPFSSVGDLNNAPDMTADPDHSALATIAEKLRFS
jgi:histidine triad (HIT) family protein